MSEMVGGCCVCSDERGWPDNPLVYCDGNGCTVAVHQACYGIVAVPSGPWFCRKCESPDKQTKVRCELCPTRSGALKRTDTNGWAHVVCALYIPEVRFGNVTSMEPIILQLIPQERFNKTCYICQEAGKQGRASTGACMQCNKTGCKQQFHVTCAQSLGLLCEEAGNYIDNVKYCGYCQHHYSKLKKGGNVKTIPPYKPTVHDSQSSDSCGEKESEDSQLPFTGSPRSKSKLSGSKKSTHSSTLKTSSSTTKSTPTTSTTSSSKSHQEKGNKKASSPSEAHRKSATPQGESSGTGSKPSTPSPSPQHTELSASVTTPTSKSSSNTLIQSTQSKGAIQPNPTATATAPKQSPSSSEAVGVISSVASSTASSAVISTTQHSTLSPTPSKYSNSVNFQESVIANNDYLENKQTKKRKAITQASMSAATDYSTSSSNHSISQSNESGSQLTERAWDGNTPPLPPDPPPEAVDVKKPKTEPPSASTTPVIGNAFSEVTQYTQSASHTQPSPGRHLPSPNTQQPGGSIVSNSSNLRSPSNIQGSSDNRMHWPHTSHGYEASGSHEFPGDKSLHSGSLANVAIRNKKRAALNTNSTHTSQPSLHTSIPLPIIQPPVTMTIKRTPVTSSPYPETIKESPPSSPGSERSVKTKSEARLTASQMLGNELNPESSAAMRLSEHLSAELVRLHAASQQRGPTHLPPPLLNKATSGRSGGSSSSGGSSAQSLDQLLERQWEQGSQFLMEQAQHFDIASLLSCLHQLRTENVRLEEHVSGLQQRRDHLLAVNARLAIPLTTVPTGPPEPPRPPPPRQL